MNRYRHNSIYLTKSNQKNILLFFQWKCKRLNLISFQKTANQRLFSGTTVDPLMSLPAANRKDPQLAPPPITEDEARHGILSLLERGLIPPGAELTLEPSPVKHKLAQIYSAEDRKQDKPVIAGTFHFSPKWSFYYDCKFLYFMNFYLSRGHVNNIPTMQF